MWKKEDAIKGLKGEEGVKQGSEYIQDYGNEGSE